MNSRTARKPSRTLVAWVTILGLTTTLAACGLGGNDGAANAPVEEVRGLTESSRGEPVDGGELVVALEAESESWLPSEGNLTTSTRNVAYALYDPLVATGEDGEEHPYLAESITPDPELDEWTVTLRPDVRFHDGTPLDAATMKTIFDEFHMAPNSATLGFLDEIQELRVDGELTFTYVLSRPNGAFPTLLTGPIGWPFSPEAARAPETAPGSRVAGTGPFRLASWAPDSQLVVTRNDDYWRPGLPHLDGITFRPVPDEQLRADLLLNGVVDAIQALRGPAIKSVIAAEDEGFTAHTFTGDDASVAVMNTTRPPFDDLRIRRAVATMTDPNETTEILGDDGLVEPSTQFFGADSPWYSEQVAAAQPKYDPDTARSLVGEYVNDPDRSDGLPVGTPPEFEYLCLTDPALLLVAEARQRAAENVGFAARTRAVDTATLVGSLRGTAETDPPFTGDFLTGCFRSQTTGEPATTFGAWFGAPTEEAGNVTNFTTPELVHLINELRRTHDFDERFAITEQIGMIINTQLPLVFVSATPTMIGVRDEVKNVAGWTTPDGEPGNGVPYGVTRWGEVWLAR